MPASKQRNAKGAQGLQFPGEFWQSVSFEDLARIQGIRPMARLEEILGGWPSDDLADDFGKTLSHWRQAAVSTSSE